MRIYIACEFVEQCASYLLDGLDKRESHAILRSFLPFLRI